MRSSCNGEMRKSARAIAADATAIKEAVHRRRTQDRTGSDRA